MTARIRQAAVRVPPIFPLLQAAGNIPQRDMYNTFNMGVGMVAVVPAAQADAAVAALSAEGVAAYCLGEIVPGDEGVVLW